MRGRLAAWFLSAWALVFALKTKGSCALESPSIATGADAEAGSLLRLLRTLGFTVTSGLCFRAAMTDDCHVRLVAGP